jgi:anti-sigma B factor antagonist
MPASLLRSDHRDGAISVVDESPDILAISLEGEFDMRDAPRLAEELDRAFEGQKDVILDLSAATFIDSSVIHVLCTAAKATKVGGRTTVLQLGTAPIVERVLEIAAVERLIPRANSRSEAIEIIQGAGAPASS